jgi:hypothetical protein
MSSPIMVVARTTVLLSFLVVVPVLALVGVPGPRPFQERRSGAEHGASPALSHRDGPELPPREHVAAAPGDAGPWRLAAESQSRIDPSRDWPPGASVRIGGREASASSFDERPSSPRYYAAFVEKARGEADRLREFADVPWDHGHGGIDRVQYVRERLKDLGASYLLLETLAGHDRAYRFRCDIILPGEPPYTRRFEVTGADPLTAMEQVLAQVEVWCGGRTARGTTTHSGGLLR